MSGKVIQGDDGRFVITLEVRDADGRVVSRGESSGDLDGLYDALASAIAELDVPTGSAPC